MSRTNKDRLIRQAVGGEITNPIFRAGGYRITHDGQPVVLPSVGSITYNVRVGDRAGGWVGDHIEPGVSIRNLGKDKNLPDANIGLNFLACVGNEAEIISGKAEGEKGVVTGKHGGIEHVIIDFSSDILEKLRIADKIMIKAFGIGLKLVDYPTVKVMNLAPTFLEKIDITYDKQVVVPVTHRIPAQLMGSGLGAATCYHGDYDIQLFDKGTVEEYGLDDLRLGDLVAILDTDHSFGRVYKQGSLSVGIIVHSDCVTSGHGPGVTTLFTCNDGTLDVRIDPAANIANILELRAAVG